MAAPTLSLSSQKKALSAKKNKKVVKNVLGLPASVKVESALVGEKECENLTRILERLLPIARIPVRRNDRDGAKVTEQDDVEVAAIKMGKAKRKGLALGVNELNRSIKKNLISAALFASDIHPKFLIHHLNLLCRHNEIPFLHISGLRKLTQTGLGFPCIAVGFRKDSIDFEEVIKEIQSVAKTKNFATNESDSVDCKETSDSEVEDIPPILKAKHEGEPEKKFSYLYRKSVNERVFIPEAHKKDVDLTKNKAEAYIAIGDNLDDNISKAKKKNVPIGISTCLIKKQAEKKRWKLEDSDVDEFVDDVYEVPKKKAKVDWIVDKVGSGKKFKYSSANVVKIHSNANRKKG